MNKKRYDCPKTETFSIDAMAHVLANSTWDNKAWEEDEEIGGEYIDTDESQPWNPGPVGPAG